MEIYLVVPLLCMVLSLVSIILMLIYRDKIIKWVVAWVISISILVFITSVIVCLTLGFFMR